PLRLGESATAFAAHVVATIDADNISTRCIDSPSFSGFASPRKYNHTESLAPSGRAQKAQHVAIASLVPESEQRPSREARRAPRFQRPSPSPDPVLLHNKRTP